uniref:Zinc finger protein 622 n=1 Tax=Ascaris suum TaxID=6253 RepID=F1KYZ8_ASCSU
MSGKLDATTGLTCICCRVVFANSDIQREHYRTDWHRYNLKRKVAALPPITADQFQEKVLSYRDKAAEEEAAASHRLFCEVCNKQFQSTNAYDNHLNSKRHKENDSKSSQNTPRKVDAVNLPTGHLAKQSTEKENKVVDSIDALIESNVEEEDSDSEGWVTDHGTDTENEEYDESKGIAITVCLFCLSPSANMEQNLAHMGRFHGFFLPDVEFCVDVEGMLRYLGLKVGSGNMCLLCNEKGRRFRSLDACQKHMKDKAHCRVAHDGNAMLEYEEFYDYSSMYAENEEDAESSDVLVEDGYSLVLPSGARIGHRSLMRYYRQHLKPVSEEGWRKSKDKQTVGRLIGQYKALGWTGTTGTLAVQRAKDIHFMKRLSSEQWLKLGITSNKLFVSRGRSGQ